MEEFSSNKNKSGVNVVIRIRPSTTRDFTNSYYANYDLNAIKRQVVYPDTSSQNIIHVEQNSETKTYTFDQVAGATTTQYDMFDKCGRPIVESCLDGYNGTIFCYGQTGAGKTYTMIGPDHDAGLIPRILESLFESIERRREADPNWRASLQVSFLEIYNEKIQDLLVVSDNTTNSFIPQKKKDLEIREDHRKRIVFVEGLSKYDIESPVDGMIKLQDGLANRHVGTTRMNAESSRSHSVFTIKIKSRQVDSSEVTHKKTSYLHLIDLAGSERQQSTGAEGDRLKEACNINKTLSQLAMVINHLTEAAKGKQLHIPYRDSKLTYLLKDSLGGNSKTVIIANVSPSASHVFESVQTLEFAKRAKNIKNKPMVNEVQKGDIHALQRKIQMLEEQLQNQQFAPRAEQESHVERQRIVITESEKEEYDERCRLFLDRVEQAEKQRDLLQHKLDQQTNIAEGKEMLLHATRLALKLKECSLAKLENREPEFGTSLLKLDYLHDFDLDESDMDIDIDEDEVLSEVSEKRELPDVQRLEKLLKKVWHPDRHPTVISFAMENYELREKLEQYETEQYAVDKEKTTSYIRVLEQQMYDLIHSHHNRLEKIEQQHASKQEQSGAAISQTQSLIQALQEENAALTRRLEEIKHHQDEMMPLHEVELIVSELEAARSQRDAVQAMCSELESQIEQYKQKLEIAQSEQYQINQTCESLQSQVDTLQIQLNEVSNVLNENESLKIQNKRWKQEFDNECNKTAEQSRAITDLMQQINQQRKLVSQVRDEQDEANRSAMAKDHEVNILSQELSNLHTTVQELQSSLDLEQRRCKAFERRQCDADEAKQRAIEEQFKLSAALQAEQDKCSHLQVQLNATSSKVDQLQAGQISLASENTDLHIEIQALRDEIKRLQERMIQSNQENHNRSLNTSTSVSLSESNKVEQLQKQLEAIENSVFNLTRLYNTKKRKFGAELRPASSPNVKGVTAFKKIMNMLGELESLSVNNRGMRGSNSR